MSSSQASIETKRHVRGSALLLAGRMFSVAINFLAQVLIVRYLSKEGYGAFAYGYGIASLGARMAALGTDKAAARFIPIFHENNELSRVKGSLFLVFGTIAVTGTLLVGSVIACQGVLSTTLVRDPLSLSVLLVIISLAPLLALESLLDKLLALFGWVQSLFVRRYIVTPLLRLTAVVALLVYGGDAYFLATAYVLSTLIGVAFSFQLLWRNLNSTKMLSEFGTLRGEVPATQFFRFGIPLLSTDAAFGLRMSLVPVLLEVFHGALGVAAFSAVLPFARLNQLVFDTFKLLYVPTASRFLARNEIRSISDLYWRSSAWIAVLTFPLFLLTFSLATPITTLLLGPEYASSGPILSVLAFGFYANASFGFNSLTLRVFDRVRTIMKVDLCAAGVALLANLAVVPRFGPLGGALVCSVVLIGQNLAYYSTLRNAEFVSRVPRYIAFVYLRLLGLAIILLALQEWLDVPLYVGVGISAMVSLAVWLSCLKVLQVDSLFPELRNLLSRRSRNAGLKPVEH